MVVFEQPREDQVAALDQPQVLMGLLRGGQAQDAIDEARRRGEAQRIPALEERAALYRAGRPFIQR